VDDFLVTLERIVKGASVVDPALVQELVAARRVNDPLEDLSPREREVLALMAERRPNAGIARQLWVTQGTVEKHVHSILMKLRLPETGDDHRRVLAVVTYLDRPWNESRSGSPELRERGRRRGAASSKPLSSPSETSMSTTSGRSVSA
jgi:DNA-binding NarL/FixJ family response regulator